MNLTLATRSQQRHQKIHTLCQRRRKKSPTSCSHSKTYLSLNLDVSIRTKGDVTKFKLRCSRYLYTIKIDDPSRAEKIKGTFPSSIILYLTIDLKKIELNQKTKKEEKKKVDPKKKQQ